MLGIDISNWLRPDAFVAGLVGFGMGLASTSMANVVVGGVPAEQTHAATGMTGRRRARGPR